MMGSDSVVNVIRCCAELMSSIREIRVKTSLFV